MTDVRTFLEEHERDDHVVLYVDNQSAVSIETIGKFMQQLGRAAQQIIGHEDIVIELVDFHQGSLRWTFEWGEKRDDVREARESRIAELAEIGERRGKRLELYAVVALALSAPAAALATHQLLEEARSSEISLSAPKRPTTRITKDELNTSAKAISARSITYEQKQDMLREYEDGALIDTAGRIMPRKISIFRTASDTRLPIIFVPDSLQPGLLVRIRAEVRKGDQEIGIIILDYEVLDDP
jgi:hypothetical protein